MGLGSATGLESEKATVMQKEREMATHWET